MPRLNALSASVKSASTTSSTTKSGGSTRGRGGAACGGVDGSRRASIAGRPRYVKYATAPVGILYAKTCYDASYSLKHCRNMWPDGDTWMDIKLNQWYDQTIAFLPNLLFIAVILLVTRIISWQAQRLVGRLTARTQAPAAIGDLLGSMARFVVVAFGILLVLGQLGLSSAVLSFVTGLGITGIIIGFALPGYRQAVRRRHAALDAAGPSALATM